jgi:pimeloyl-ACP methyl ester carboxylesterase
VSDSRTRGLIGLGAGLAAAGVGAAFGLAAERWTASRAIGGGASYGPEGYGMVRGTPVPVLADDGTSLYTEVDEPAADATAPVTVVFSHGYCLTQDIWHYQRQWLRGRHRLVLWDQRGHGRSGTGPDEHYTLAQCGRDLRSVLAAAAPEGPVVLVGHSMGGMTVMSLAAQDPDLLRRRTVGVAFVATSSGGLADVSWGLRPGLGRLAHRLAPGALAGLTRAPQLVDRTRRIGSDLEALVVRRYSYASPVSPELVRFTAAMIADTPIDVVAGFLPTFDDHDAGEALPVLDGVEALVVSGEDDLLTPPEHSAAIVRRLPGAEQVLVPHAGHLIMLEHPDVVNLHLGELVERAQRAQPLAAGDPAPDAAAEGPGGRRRPRLRRPGPRRRPTAG